jgi:hypothetical protein
MLVMSSSVGVSSGLRTRRPGMSYDYTLRTYEGLCQIISPTQKDCRFIHYLEHKDDSRIILRHDVDRMPRNALRMASLEHRMGLKSTYYFRSVPVSFDEYIIKRISGMGHEIGYHYEVMSKSKGDIQQAKRIFNEDLKLLRSICEIRTACMHGSPSSDINNLDFWKFADLSDFGLQGEAYSDIGEQFFYCTDTGGRWNSKNNIRDKIGNCNMPFLQGTESIISEISSGSCMYINCHPERWAESSIEIPSYRMKDLAVNLVKRAFRYLKLDQG